MEATNKMKTRELIALLQEIDPDGENEVVASTSWPRGNAPQAWYALEECEEISATDQPGEVVIWLRSTS